MIRSLLGRRVLLGVILLAFLSSFVVLMAISRGGAVSHAVVLIIVKRLVEFYMPLLGILAGFYFSEMAVSKTGLLGKTSYEAFVLAVCLTGLWVTLPPVLLLMTETVEGAMRYLETAALANVLPMGALTYYFSKSGRDATGS